MYSTCLFCHGSLGRNDRIEHFPVGRRLAFDAAKGRLWAICPGCARWNLTPLEERWEAIEECERAFPAARRLAVTDHVSLARDRSGLDLVCIGQPNRRELRSWRWGRELRRRRVRGLLSSNLSGLVSLAVEYSWMAGPIYWIPAQIVHGVVEARRDHRRRQQPVTHADTPDGQRVLLRAGHLDRLAVTAASADGWTVRIPIENAPAIEDASNPLESLWPGLRKRRPVADTVPSITLDGAEAARVVTLALARQNAGGASATDVDTAVRRLAATRSEPELVTRTLSDLANSAKYRGLEHGSPGMLPAVERVMLEMVLAESSEQTALDGELAALETAWRNAEEIAEIADGLLLPNEVARKLTELKQR